MNYLLLEKKNNKKQQQRKSTARLWIHKEEVDK